MEQTPAHFHRNKIRSSPTDALHEPNALERATLPFKVCVCKCTCIHTGHEETWERITVSDRHLTRPSAGLDLCNLSWKVCVFSAGTEYKVWVSDKCDYFASLVKKGREKRRGKRANFLVWWVMITDPGRDLNAHWSVIVQKVQLKEKEEGWQNARLRRGRREASIGLGVVPLSNWTV